MSTGHRRHDVEIDVPVGTISRTQGRMLDSSFTFRNEADCRDHVAGLPSAAATTSPAGVVAAGPIRGAA